MRLTVALKDTVDSVVHIRAEEIYNVFCFLIKNLVLFFWCFFVDRQNGICGRNGNSKYLYPALHNLKVKSKICYLCKYFPKLISCIIYYLLYFLVCKIWQVWEIVISSLNHLLGLRFTLRSIKYVILI